MLVAHLESPDKLPPFRDCQERADSDGVAETEELKEGDILCLKTDEGRIARLKVTYVAISGTNTLVRSNVTVWERTESEVEE